MIGAGIDVVVEKHTALGRSDLEVETGNRRWIFEFKFAKDEEEVNRMALVFDAAQRRFVAWQRV